MTLTLLGGCASASPPPLGDIAIETVTPPGASLSSLPLTHCDERVPGYMADGYSDLAVGEVWAWYDQRFGGVNAEASDRLSAQRGERVTVYDDLTVRVTSVEDGRTWIRVTTFDTVAHNCPPTNGWQTWDLSNAWSFIDACDKPVIEFWDVQYVQAESSSPPPDWTKITFESGRAIAHGTSDPSTIYAKQAAQDEWHAYLDDAVCFLD
jgi:hypothetical protein